MFEATGMIIWGIAALLIAVIIIRAAGELFRRWFVKVEYPCESCGSRFTTLHGKWMDISTGTLYATHCLACKHQSKHSHPYHFGTGRWCGESVSGWQRKPLTDTLAEDAAHRR